MLRPVWRLGRCQGVLSPQKGHLGPKTGFSTLAPASAWSRTLACQEYIPFGIYSQPHVLASGQFIFFECVVGHIPPKMGHFPMS